MKTGTVSGEIVGEFWMRPIAGSSLIHSDDGVVLYSGPQTGAHRVIVVKPVETKVALPSTPLSSPPAKGKHK